MSTGLINMTEQAKNVLETGAIPFDVRKPSVVGGSMSHVAFEVLVSYIARRVLKSERRSILELAAIHTLAIPFEGGLTAFTEAPNSLGFEAPMASQFVDGAKGVPAVFAGTYIANTFMDGLHAPRLNFKDILITAASKIITKPLRSQLHPYLGQMYRNGTVALNKTFQAQYNASLLKMT